MPVALPFVSDPPVYRVGTTLDGEVFIFDVRWNARDEAWYFDLYTEDETLIRAGVKIVLGILAGRDVSANSPGGEFIATDTAGGGVEAGLEDLGDRVIVHFYTYAELLAL